MDKYAAVNRIDQEPVFSWWDTYVLKDHKAILQKVEYRYFQRTHKYGIFIPKTVQEAINEDRKNRETLWG